MLSLYFRQAARFAVRPTSSVAPAVTTQGLSSTRCLATKAASETKPPKEKKEKKPKSAEKAKAKPKKEEKPARIVIGKDQLPPSKPVGAFARFVLENREFFSQEGAAFELVKPLAEKWHQLSAQEKKKYEITTEEWEEYHRRTAEWKENVPPKILKEINRKRKAKGLRPLNNRTRKQPPGPYLLFLADHRASQPQLDADLSPQQRMLQIVKLGAERWNNLSDAERQVYRDKAAVLRKEYKESVGQDSTPGV
ncbi:hypothetical protein MD484_g7675, partial [Candolleomyces efflorescens]